MDMRLWMASQTGKTKTQLDWQNRNINEYATPSDAQRWGTQMGGFEAETPKKITAQKSFSGAGAEGQLDPTSPDPTISRSGLQPGLDNPNKVTISSKPETQPKPTGYEAIKAGAGQETQQKENDQKIEDGYFDIDRAAKRAMPGYRLGRAIADLVGGKSISDVVSDTGKEIKNDVVTTGKYAMMMASPIGYYAASKMFSENKKVPDSEDIEMEEMEKLRSANAADLKEMPGKAGETAHKNLHKTVDAVLSKMDKMHPEQLAEDPMMGNMLELGAAGVGGAALYGMLRSIMQNRQRFQGKPTGYEVMKDLIDSGRMPEPGEPKTMPGIPLTPEQQDALQQELAAREILRDKAYRTIAAATSDDAAKKAAAAAVIQAKKETASSVNPRPPKPPPCPGCGR